MRSLFSDSPISADMFDFCCGNLIGSGMSRTVYDWNLMNGAVVKIEKPGYFQNQVEWDVWHRVKDTEYAKWFAPCISISPCGLILVMAKTRPITHETMPDKIPAFFTDLKWDNVGIYKRHPVFHDYGCHLMLENGMTKRMKKVGDMY